MSRKEKPKSKWNSSDDEDSDDELTDDIAGAQLKIMLKKILKKNPDIVDKQDMDFFGKYRPALQKQYKRNKIESLFLIPVLLEKFMFSSFLSIFCI